MSATTRGMMERMAKMISWTGDLKAARWVGVWTDGWVENWPAGACVHVVRGQESEDCTYTCPRRALCFCGQQGAVMFPALP
jgi:hypothetical protein